MIEAVGLTKIYNQGKKHQVEAVKDVSISADCGEIAALVGPSGCGKTTLMSMIGQLLTPTRGKVLFHGEDITAYSDGWKAMFRRKNVGFIFQHINLLPNLNALQNVITPLLCHDIDPEEHFDIALNLLDELGLSDRANFNVGELSGGQQQRVAVARALVTKPTIIVADEPLTFVDNVSAKTITDFFESLKKEGKVILISTHSSSLLKLADKTYMMSEGRVIDSR